MDENFKNQLGKKLLKRGEVSFFLHPGESIPEGIKSVHVLGENDGLVLRAVEEFEDRVEGFLFQRKAGDRWMIKGPCEYVPTRVRKPWLALLKVTNQNTNLSIILKRPLM